MTKRKKSPLTSDPEQSELSHGGKPHVSIPAPLSSETAKWLDAFENQPFDADEEDEEEDDEMGESLSPEAAAAFLRAAQGGVAPNPMIYSDKFSVISDAFTSESVKGIELPKMIFKGFKTGQALQDKSAIMVYLDVTQATVKEKLFERLFKACKKTEIGLTLKWLVEKEKNVQDVVEVEEASVWKFEGACIHGVDFGNVMTKRPDINMISIEISYTALSIDGVSI